MNHIKNIPAALIALILVALTAITPDTYAANINGSVKQVGTQKILNLWGSNYEMGYAHGYLMTEEIRTIIDHYMVGRYAGGNLNKYNDWVNTVEQYGSFDSKYQDEIDGMIAGMIASGKSFFSEALKRNIDVRDLKAWNFLAETSSYLCSSFAVWGNAAFDNKSIVARELDYFYDSAGDFVNSQMLITYEPTGGAKFVAFSWPGFIGLATGMNESGVTVSINVAAGESSDNPLYHPTLAVARTILENTTVANFLAEPLAAVNSVQEYSPFIFQIGSAYDGFTDPVYYIEDSSASNIIRYAADTEPAYDHIIATNNFMKVTPPPPPGGESIDRYNFIRNKLLELYQVGDLKIDSNEAWSVLKSVTSASGSLDGTLMDVVMRPDKMEFDLSFSTFSNGILTRADDKVPQTYSWASLFPNHDPNAGTNVPDLIIQTMTITPTSPVTGQSVNVTMTIKNQGTADAGGFRVDLYKEAVSPPVLNQLGDASCSLGTLTIGASTTCSVSVTYAVAGSYQMRAQVDTSDQVRELNEANNLFGPGIVTVKIPSASAPDLLIQAMTISPTSAGAGQTVNVRMTIKNQGTASADGFRVDLYKNAASPPALNQNGDASCSLATLAIGASTTCSVSVTYAVAGSYPMRAQVDTSDQVRELNETNNLFGPNNITIGYPDLVITSLSTSGTARVCRSLLVTSTTKNQGSFWSPASTTRFYLSRDSSYDLSDVVLGAIVIQSRAAGAQSSGYTSVTIPCGTTVGSYYIIGRADADDIVVESTESNNTRSSSININR